MKRITKYFQSSIFFLGGIIIAVVASEYLEQLSTTFEHGLIVLIAIILMLIATLLKLLDKNLNSTLVEGTKEVHSLVQETVNTLGVRVRYVEDRWIKQNREGKVFAAVHEIVKSAKEEILISGYNDPTFDPILTTLSERTNDAAQQRRIAYLDTIENKLGDDNTSAFRYYRILQLPNANIELNQHTLGPIEWNHCYTVLSTKEVKQNLSINIMKMETERISTFVIIDNKYLILSDLGTRRTERGEAEYLAGVFIIEDLTGNVIKGFREYFWSQLLPNATVIRRRDLIDIRLSL